MKIKYISLISAAMLFAVAANCQSQITTLQPPSTLISNEPICAGSVMDIPFISTGTYDAFNIYYAQLIDSIGHTAKIDTIGHLLSNATYPNTPGDVTDLIPSDAPTGCKYYVRIVSSTPNTTSIVWGPFCVQHCDILTNHQQSVPLTCLESCQKQPHGVYDTISYSIHRYDSHAHYYTGNKFEAQLIQFSLNPPSFTPVNTGLLGVKVDTVSSKIYLHIPCPDTLFAHGINPGVYYLRIIADSSSYPDSAFGTLVYLIIGEPADSLYLTLGSPGPFCAGSIITVLTNPDDTGAPFNSTYTWWESDKTHGKYQIEQGNYGELLTYYNGADTMVVSCQEDNYGCLGNQAITISIIIKPALLVPRIIYNGTTFTSSVPIGNQWFRYNTLLPGETKDTLITSIPGCYYTELTDTDGCKSISDTICINITGIQNISAEQGVNIYPNPNSGSFTIQSSIVSRQWSVEVYNVLGENVYSQFNLQHPACNIDINNQPNGVYFVKIKLGNQIINRKLVLMK